MRKLLLLFLFLVCVGFSYAQEDGIEVISLGRDFFRKESILKPIVREVVGGTIIQVIYEGNEWEQNLDRKNAFEHACRIFEEQLPTALPIKVKVKFGKLRGSNVIAKTTLHTDSCKMDPRDDLSRAWRSTIKWKFKDLGLGNAKVGMSFFDKPDGEIIFNSDDIYSFSLNDVQEDKYDFVTVALRELCKIMGFYFSARGDNATKVIEFDRNSLFPFDLVVLGNQVLDPFKAYSYATSNKATLSVGGFGPYGLYSPTIFEYGLSLCFFKPDETDNETRLMQPGLPRGTSIRNIGGWFKGFLKAIDWVHYTAVGGGGGGEPTVTSTSTDKAKRYDEVCTFSNPQKSLNYNVALRNEEVVDKDDVDKYIWQHSSYALDDDGDILYGWVVSVLRKDGTWEIIPSTSSWNESEVSFMPSSIDVNKADQYARSSDGYLRCRVNYTSYPVEVNRLARYFLLDYLPQKPEMAFSKVMPQTRTVADDYYADVKIGFKNVEGTEKILVEQLEEGSPVPFTYYVEDVRDGYFIASVDKEYSTTFKLRAMNKYGETVSEQLIVAPLVPATYTLNSQVNGDLLSLKLEKGRKRSLDDRALIDYRVLDLNHSMIVREGKVDNNIIDISSLEKGMYGLQVSDTEGRSYDTKFVR